MGADGGICIFPIKNPCDKNRNRIYELLAPFDLFCYELRDEDDEYINDNKINYKDSIIFRYGTDIDFYADEYFTDAVNYKYERFFTFKDVAEDLITKPIYEIYEEDPIDFLVKRCCISDFEYINFQSCSSEAIDKLRSTIDFNKLLSVKNMEVRAWQKELKILIDINKKISVETWT